MINSPRVCIQVQSVYIEAQSSPDDERYVFAYTVTIRNLGRAPVQLLGRYWLITNGHGRETEVQGEGVVGLVGSEMCIRDSPYTHSLKL